MTPGASDTLLKCPSNVWGKAIEATGTLRVRCNGKFCRNTLLVGAPDKVIFHIFDLSTGEFRTELLDYRNPRELLG